MLIYFLNSAIELPIWRYIFLFYQIFYSVFTPNHGIYLIKWKLDRSTLKDYVRHDLSGFFSDLEGWSLKLVLFINYMYLRHMPFLKHEEFNIRKCIHDLSGHVDRFIWFQIYINKGISWVVDFLLYLHWCEQFTNPKQIQGSIQPIHI